MTGSEQQPKYYPAESSVQDFSNGHHSLLSPSNNRHSTSNSFLVNNSVPSSQRSSYIYQEQIPTSEQLPHHRSSYSSAGSYGINRSYSDSIPLPQPASYLFDAPYQRASSSSYQYSNRPPEQIPRDNESQSSSGFNIGQNGYLQGIPYPDDSHHSPTPFKGTNNNTIYRTLDFSSTDNQMNNSSNSSPKPLPHPPHSPTLSTDTYPKEINYAVIQKQSNQDPFSPHAESLNSSTYSNNKYADLYFTDVNSPQDNSRENHDAMLPANPAAPYSKDMYGAQTDLSKLSIESDFSYKTSSQNPRPEYATIQRRSTGNIENLYKTDSLLSDRPNSIIVPVRRSVSDVPKQTSLQLLQNMHMNELRKHPSFSKTFPKNYSPNYQNISQTFSQYSDDDDDDHFQRLSDEGPIASDRDKWEPMPSDYKRPSSTDPVNLLDQDVPDNDVDKILYDYKGTSHDTSFPTRSFQELSVKTLEHPNNLEFGVIKPPVSDYANLNARQSFAYSSSRSELDGILPRSSSGNFDEHNYGKYSPSQANLNGFQVSFLD